MRRCRALLLVLLAGFVLGRWSAGLAGGGQSTPGGQSGLLLAAPSADNGARSRILNVQAVNSASAELYLTNPFVSFGRVQPGDGDGYHELPQASRLILRSNTPWRLYARVESDLVAAEDLTRVIPIQQLEFRTPSGSYTQFVKGKRFLIASGGPTGATPASVDVDLRLRVTWEDLPGSYQVRILYELETEDE
ncbi:MAG: hypothetical protein IMX00_03915 [Limnochordales bacterium]|nr:hypothetical protein [Limnochordales bacterium]